jgi:protein-L-isoaspartate(D-aspartate) O-methyltransferase
VLDALREIPRHRFVPGASERDAYDDRPLPIGEGQTISQPYMVAVMTASLDPRADDRVLEIGTGSGYQTSILARLARRVVSIERHETLARRAAAVLAELGLDNVHVVVGDGTEGYLPDAPYDRILVTAGAPVVPDSLTAQLADSGRLVIPVGPAGLQEILIVDRRGAEWSERRGEACTFVPLIGRFGWPERSRG